MPRVEAKMHQIWGKGGEITSVAVDMDIHGYIHGYIHVWISDFGNIHGYLWILMDIFMWLH